jgi:hypothetical protein
VALCVTWRPFRVVRAPAASCVLAGGAGEIAD